MFLPCAHEAKAHPTRLCCILHRESAFLPPFLLVGTSGLYGTNGRVPPHSVFVSRIRTVNPRFQGSGLNASQLLVHSCLPLQYFGCFVTAHDHDAEFIEPETFTYDIWPLDLRNTE